MKFSPPAFFMSSGFWIVLLCLGQGVLLYQSFAPNTSKGASLTESEDWRVFAEDLNEIRSFLLLPTKNYGQKGEELEQAATIEADDLVRESFVKMLQSMQTIQEQEQARQASFAWLAPLKAMDWSSYGLELAEEDQGFTLRDPQFLNADFLKFEWTPQGRLVRTGFLDKALKSFSLEEKPEVFQAELQLKLAENLKKFRDGLSELTNYKNYWEKELFVQEEFQTFLKEHHLTLQGPQEQGDSVVYRLEHPELAWVMDFSLNTYEMHPHLLQNPQLDEGNPVYSLQNPQESFEAMKNLLADDDLRTKLEKDLALMKKEMEALMKDPAVLVLLKALSLQLSGPELTSDFLIYTLKKTDGTLLKEFKIRLQDGQIMLGDELIEEHQAALQNLIAGKKKTSKSQPLYLRLT